MKVSKSSSGILSSGGAVVGSDLTIDGTTITVDESANSVGIGTSTPGAKLEIQDTTTGSASTGGSLRLSANDGAPMGDSHRLGVIEFTGAEDSSNTQIVGARIEALTDAAWTNVENGCALYFYTTDGNASETNVLKIDSNQKSTFNGNIQANGNIDLTGGLSFDGSATVVTSIDTDLSSVSGSHDTLVTAKAAKAYADSVAGGGTSDLTDVSGTLAVGSGGTGATSLTDGGVLLGSGTGAVTATAVLANGELLIGDNSGDPTVATLTAGDGIDVTNGAGSITIAAEDSTASNKGVVIVAGGTDCTVTYSSGTATVAVDNLAASKITSGTLADARISQSSVTQHQASITGSGALNSGSITSGFGNIDIGSSTFDTTGAVGTGALTAAGDIVATGGDLTLGTAADANNATITAAAESGTNTSGKTLTIGGGLGTGTGVPGSVSITSASPTGSGTGAHTAVTVAQFASEGPTLNYGGVANLLDNEAVGEKVFFGTGQTVKGKLYYLNTSGAWVLADADAEASTAALIAVACGGDGSGSANDAATHGMLIRGFIDNASYLTGTYNEGVPVYVDGTAGNMTVTRPTSGFVRVIGWCCATANVIYFNPDNTYLEL